MLCFKRNKKGVEWLRYIYKPIVNYAKVIGKYKKYSRIYSKMQ